MLRDAKGFESYYVRGVSKHYGNELAIYPRLFQMDHYYASYRLLVTYLAYLDRSLEERRARFAVR